MASLDSYRLLEFSMIRSLLLVLIALNCGAMLPVSLAEEPPPPSSPGEIDRLARELRIHLYQIHQHDRAAYEIARAQLQAALVAWESSSKSVEHTAQLAAWLQAARKKRLPQQITAWPTPPTPIRNGTPTPPPTTPSPSANLPGEVPQAIRADSLPQTTMTQPSPPQTSEPNFGEIEPTIEDVPAAPRGTQITNVPVPTPADTAPPARANSTHLLPIDDHFAPSQPEDEIPLIGTPTLVEPELQPAARSSTPRSSEPEGSDLRGVNDELANPPSPFNPNPPLPASVPPPLMPPSVADDPTSELVPPAFAPRQVPLPGVEVPVVENLFHLRTAGNNPSPGAPYAANQVNINFTEIAARVAGYNSAMHDLELKLATAAPDNLPELAALLSELEDLSRRRHDLLLYENALPEIQRAQLARLTTPQTATGLLAAQIVRLRNKTQEPAGLGTLDDLSRRLAKLAEK